MKLLCVDFSNLVIRHAANPYGTATDLVGQPVWGATGAITQVLRLIDQHQPTHMVIAKDCKRADSFRRQLDETYKAHRAAADEDMIRQFALAYQIVSLFSWPVVEVAAHEADDVIASAATSFEGPSAIVTGDKDLLALCSEKITVWLLRPGGPEAVNASGCLRIMGVLPRQLRDYKSLVGDKSDGILGIDGIGPKNAIKLLDAYGSLSSIYKNVDAGDDLRAVVSQAIATKIKKGREQARLSWQLAGLVDNLEIDIPALEVPARPTWQEYEKALTELGVGALQSVLTGKSAPKPTGPVDLDLAFRQLSFS